MAVLLAVKPLFRKKANKQADCHDCSSTCSGCPVMDLKSDIEKAQQSKAKK